MLNPFKQYQNAILSGGLQALSKIDKEFYNKYVITPDKSVKANKLKMGRIYTYAYDPKYKDVLAYYDTNPCVLIFGYRRTKAGDHLYTGINLHFLPKEIKLALLETYYKYFYRFGGNKLMAIMPFTYYKFFLAVFERMNGIKFKFAIRSYLIMRIDKLTQLEDSDWGLAIAVRPKFMNGATVEQIFLEYYQNKRMKKKQKENKK